MVQHEHIRDIYWSHKYLLDGLYNNCLFKLGWNYKQPQNQLYLRENGLLELLIDHFLYGWSQWSWSPFILMWKWLPELKLTIKKNYYFLKNFKVMASSACFSWYWGKETWLDVATVFIACSHNRRLFTKYRSGVLKGEGQMAFFTCVRSYSM